jgi:hypothetical protein
MADMKTRATDGSVDEFLRSIPDDARRRDCRRVLEIMRSVTGEEPKLWGASMVGFGSYHYRYESGREGDWFPIPRTDMQAADRLTKGSS